MEANCKTCWNNGIDGGPDMENPKCFNCCRLSNYEPEESMILDSFNEDYMEES